MAEFDAIVVGAGPAGSSAAIKMAQSGLKVALIDRGLPVGSKNLSGGVLWGNDLEEILPGWIEEAPIERYILNKKVGFLTDEDATVLDLHFKSWNEKPYAGVSVLRAIFDEWLANKAEEAGASLLSGINIDSLIIENGKICGVKQNEEELRAPVVILAEGANARLLLKHRLTYDGKDRFDYSDMAIGVKEVYSLNREVINERFLLDENQGIAGEFVMGNTPNKIKSGGFIYTNKDSLSIGVIVYLDSLESKDRSFQVIEYFKQHPYISRLLKDAKSVEYGAKIIPMYGYKKFPKLFGDGYLLVGDTAGFVFSNGIVIQGMNYAIKSGILAAETVIEAKKNNQMDLSGWSVYESKINNSSIMKDFKKFKNVKKMTKNERLFHVYPKALNAGFKDLLTEDGSPKDHLITVLLRNLRKSGAGIINLLKDGLLARNL